MLSNINKVSTIAYYTAKELLKSKILASTLVIGIVLFGISYIAYSFTFGAPERVTLDIGLGMLSLTSVGIAIFMGSGLLSKEIEARTVYMIVSRPVPRACFIIGKVLGLQLVLALNILILSAVIAWLFVWIGGELNNIFYWAVIFIGFESLLVLLLISALSLVTSQTLSIFIVIALYFVGQMIDEAMLTTFITKREGLRRVVDFYHYFLPAFYKLNIKNFVLYNQKISLDYLLPVAGYAITYCTALVMASVAIFNRKNLD